jgi:hypothetical protein
MLAANINNKYKDASYYISHKSHYNSLAILSAIPYRNTFSIIAITVRGVSRYVML